METGKKRYILHVDMDAFFASVEQRDHPEYKGKPVIVGADPKAGKGRGVVSTCSYEARAFGVHSAMPISAAYRACPRAIFLPVDMEKYARTSGQILKIFQEFSPDVEQVSIDEAFLDISGTYTLHDTASAACMEIKRRIQEDVRLTASIGLAPTKMAAKIASGLKKPDGFVEVGEEGLLDFLWPLDVGQIWGIGPKTKNSLNLIGVTTIGDLAKKDKHELVRLFGKHGLWFWEMAQGIDDSEVQPETEAKSISNETTFENDTSDKKLIVTELLDLCEEVAYRLRHNNLKCKTVTLKIRTEEFQTYTRSITVPLPTNLSNAVSKEIKRLYDDFEIKDKKIRLVGVRASNFSVADEQVTLFTDTADIKQEKVQKAVDKIREKYGKKSVFHTV